jgi:hypothetical protein
MTHANDATPNGMHESRNVRAVRKARYQQIADTLREEIGRGFDTRDRLMLAVIPVHPGYSYRSDYRRSDIAHED